MRRGTRPTCQAMLGWLVLCGSTVLFASQDPVSPAPAELREYVERFTGSQPTECGADLFGGLALQQAISCGIAAAKERKPFWAFQKRVGIDSILFDGLVGTSSGVIYQFSYDDSPGGGPGGDGRFVISRCDGPFLRVMRASEMIGCDRR